MSSPPFIGLTGPNAAGKGAVAEHLATRGYHARSLSDVIREEAARQGEEPIREVLIRLGNELRREGGPGALAKLIIRDLAPLTVIDSIRNPAEVEALRELEGFVLLRVIAPTQLRFSRSVERGRPGDPADLEAFKAREAQENSKDPAAQQLDATGALADHEIVNEGTPEELAVRLDALLDSLS